MKPAHRWIVARLAIALGTVAGCAAIPTIALASDFYVETGGGAAKIASSSLGYNLNVGAFYNLSNRGPLEFQFGLMERWLNAATAGVSSGYQNTFFDLRLQASLLYVGFGISPLVFDNNGSASVLSGYHRESSTFAYLGELGVLWSVTPKFSMGASALVESISNASGVTRTYEANAFMRFYFGFSGGSDSGDNSSSDGSSNEFKGWRYPFGRPMQ